MGKGRIDEHAIVSERLRGNPLGDPNERPLWVYVPPGYDTGTASYPVIYVIQGYTGQIGSWRNRAPWRPSYPELVDEVFSDGETPPALVVFVDAWTKVGGSQYLDSPGTGDYHSYLCEEVVAFVDTRYRTLAAPEHRAITGKSSGGYGAMITPLLRPDVFGALATHAGDALFEVCYQADFPQVARILRDTYAGDWQAFLADFHSGRPVGTKPSDFPLIEIYGYAACYSALPDGTVQLPFDEFGTPIAEIWDRWLLRDPVRMVAALPDAARSLKAVWIDAGRSDEYYLDFGAEAFDRALRKAGVADEAVHFELFDGKHGAIEYRYPLALKWLAPRLTP
ncbi:alpha/beta hydrolase-fold protein [Actinocorallia longicatena]|uniref:Alpha/beta hydrolase-fold protein n=1 Tax=Actinocorallia longicatena TaxID=111803 RepID=A0ABP6Q9Q5_9ACTN